jgi:hypothetical protein
MKRFLLLTSVITLITTSGCLVSDGERRGHYRGHEGREHFERQADIVVTPPLVVVRPPEIIVR